MLGRIGKLARHTLATPLLFAACLPASSWAVSIDGFYSPTEGYSQLFTLTYNMADGTTLTGGSLAWGSDADGQYLYFSAPTGFVDNSYGVNSVGWGGHTHTFDELLKSDHAHMNFHTGTGGLGGTADAYIDYLALNKGALKQDPSDDTYGSCGVSTPADSGFPNQCDTAGTDALTQSIVMDVATSLEYNLTHMTYGPTGCDIDPLLNSPSTSGSDSYDGVQAGCEDWQFQVAYEIAFAANTFDPAIWGSSDPNDVGLMITFLDPHASPNKLNSTTPPEVCIGVDCVPTQVPAPAPLALMLAGLFGLRQRLRARRA